MNRAAMFVVGTALSLFACAHDDATPASRTPTGSTELQPSGAPSTPQATDTSPDLASSPRDVDNTPAASPTKPADATTVAPTAGNTPPPAAPPAPVPSSAAATAPSSRSDADNTRVNARDRAGAGMTPIDQGNNPADLKITQTIRKAVMADGTLSFTAKNVKIITRGAKVVLRGPVKTAQERASIEATARATAGVTDVDDELEVKQ
jgi:hyperosmotically inducible periplasmic protein